MADRLMTVWHPRNKALLVDTRFKDLLREISLVDYWRSTAGPTAAG
jgi:hypothetical protein